MTDLERLLALEEIRALEARRGRLLDLKDWDGYAALHVEETASSPAGGEALVGVAAMVDWIRRQIGEGDTIHHAYSPEIDFAGDDRATGVWAFQAKSRFRAPEGDTWRDSYGFYVVDYVRRDCSWKIAGRRQERLRVDEGPLPPRA